MKWFLLRAIVASFRVTVAGPKEEYYKLESE